MVKVLVLHENPCVVCNIQVVRLYRYQQTKSAQSYPRCTHVCVDFLEHVVSDGGHVGGLVSKSDRMVNAF